MRGESLIIRRVTMLVVGAGLMAVSACQNLSNLAPPERPENLGEVPAVASETSTASSSTAVEAETPTQAVEAEISTKIRFTVNKRRFLLTPPTGYCLDKSNSGPRGAYGFAIFGACDGATIKGVLTTSIGRYEGPALAQTASVLSKYFESEAGRKRLSITGTAGSIKIEETRVQNGTLYLKVTDDTRRLPGTERTIWRAFFRASGHLFAISYLPISSQKPSDEEGFAVLREFVQTTRRGNQFRREVEG